MSYKKNQQYFIKRLFINNEIKNNSGILYKFKNRFSILFSFSQKEIIDISQISPIEIEEFKLFNDNLYGIKKVILSVKESIKNICK